MISKFIYAIIMGAMCSLFVLGLRNMLIAPEEVPIYTVSLPLSLVFLANAWYSAEK
jgi:hypothetical protein